MKQVVQPLSGGPVEVIDVPRPVAGPTEVLVRTVASVISPGTERAVTELAQSNLVAKAKARPDLVRQVVAKARRDGVVSTVQTVRSRLAGDLPLGYSGAGVVLEVGEHVSGISVGQLVATGGAGKANHAEIQAVPGLLCSVVPPGVPAEDAAFATIASIALHGLRLAEVAPGSKVVVIGLGLIGRLSLRLAAASGCDVAGIDVNEEAVRGVGDRGGLAWVESGQDTTKAVATWSRGRGADAVIVAASGASSDVLRRVPDLCRDRANVVVVGDVGMDLERRGLFDKELSLKVARSYGPGRYERSYEDWGIDMPAGQVRWTEGRNLEAILDLLASGRLEVADLVTHSFDIGAAVDAYKLIESRAEPYLGIRLGYPAQVSDDAPITIHAPRSRFGRSSVASGGALGIGLIGAGAFASGVLVPSMKEARLGRFVSTASASGLSAVRLAEKAGFARAVSGAAAVIEDEEVDVVVVATAHDSHAALVAQALRAGKHVYCEKPLALTLDELAEVEAAWAEGGGVLFVGFNRRWSKAVNLVREHFGHGPGPLVMDYRVSAGTLPGKHWYHDRRQGGRVVGEVCHFIDTCSAVAGSDPCEVRALGSGLGEAALEQDAIVGLRYPDGSLASITYVSGGHSSTHKERFEIIGRGRSALIDDYRAVELDGKEVRGRLDGKGHLAAVEAFGAALGAGDRRQGHTAIASSKAALLAVAALSAPAAG